MTVTHFFAFVVGLSLIFALTLGLPDAAYQVSGPYANAVALAQLHKEFGLEGSSLSRFASAWTRLFHGDLRSMYTQEPLVPVLREKIATSLPIVVAASLITIVFGAGLAWLMSLSHGIRRVLSALVGVSATVPVFITATLLLLLSGKLSLPLAVLAAISLSLFPSFLIATNLAERWQEVRRAPYNVLAWHYGLPGHMQALRTLKASQGTAVILFNAVIYFLATGIVVVEPLFGLPGLGRWLLTSALRLDMPVLFLIGITLSGAIALLSYGRELVGLIWGSTPEAVGTQ